MGDYAIEMNETLQSLVRSLRYERILEIVPESIYEIRWHRQFFRVSLGYDISSERWRYEIDVAGLGLDQWRRVADLSSAGRTYQTPALALTDAAAHIALQDVPSEDKR